MKTVWIRIPVMCTVYINAHDEHMVGPATLGVCNGLPAASPTPGGYSDYLIIDFNWHIIFRS